MNNESGNAGTTNREGQNSAVKVESISLGDVATDLHQLAALRRHPLRNPLRRRPGRARHCQGRRQCSSQPGDVASTTGSCSPAKLYAERPEPDGTLTTGRHRARRRRLRRSPPAHSAGPSPCSASRAVAGFRPSPLYRSRTFWSLLACCPSVRKVVLADSAQRLQTYQVEALHREKLVSLGTLAAGLMHELNNPGSAAKRAASQLRENLMRLQQLSLRYQRQAQDSRAASVHERPPRARSPRLQCCPP